MYTTLSCATGIYFAYRVKILAFILRLQFISTFVITLFVINFSVGAECAETHARAYRCFSKYKKTC